MIGWVASIGGYEAMLLANCIGTHLLFHKSDKRYREMLGAIMEQLRESVIYDEVMGDGLL